MNKTQLLDEGRISVSGMSELGRMVFDKTYDEYGLPFLDELYVFESRPPVGVVTSGTERLLDWSRISSKVVNVVPTASKSIEFTRTGLSECGLSVEAEVKPYVFYYSIGQLSEYGLFSNKDVTAIGRSVPTHGFDEYGKFIWTNHSVNSEPLVGIDASPSFRNVEYYRTAEVQVGVKSTASRAMEWVRTALTKVAVAAKAFFVSTFRTTRRPLIEVSVFRFVSGAPGVDTDGVEYKFISGGGSASRWNPTTREGAGVVSCNLSFGYDQISATASLVVQSPLDLDGNLVTFKPMDRVVIRQGYDSISNLRTTFYGFVDTVELSNPEKLQRLECRDILKLAQNNYYIHRDRKIYYIDEIPDELDAEGNPLGGQSEADRQVEAVVSTFLTESGIPESRQNLPTTNITIGNNSWVVFEYESAMEAIQRMCDLTGYKVWADPQGIVQMREVQTIAASGAALTFQTQLEYRDGETFIRQRKGNIVSVASSVDDDVRNWITVFHEDPTTSGNDLTATVYGDSPYIPDPPRYRKTEITSYMLDTQDMLNTIALRIYNDLNRLRYSATLRTEGEPRLELGQTVQVVDDYTVGSGMNYFVYDYSISHDSNGYFADVTVVGGAGEGSPAVGNISPVALFRFNVNRIDLDGITYNDVWVDGSDSYDPDGNIASYLWTSVGYSPASGVTNHYLVSGAVTSITVALKVTDDDGMTDTITQVKSLEPGGGASVKERSIYYAEGTSVYATDDSGATWESFTLD